MEQMISYNIMLVIKKIIIKQERIISIVYMIKN